MKITIEGDPARLYFAYSEDGGTIVTQARLEVEPPDEPPVRFIGEAFCRPDDRFVKDVGRKLALTRLVACFTRRTRTEVWNQYLKRNGLTHPAA
jgi:hypothetical protein